MSDAIVLGLGVVGGVDRLLDHPRIVHEAWSSPLLLEAELTLLDAGRQLAPCTRQRTP